MISHDQNFKNLIADYLILVLRFLLPDWTEAWPENVKVTVIRQEQDKERLGDTFQELDIPLRIEFPDGSRETMVIVIEIERRHRPEFLHYLAIVCLKISMQQKTKRVVPIAFYPFRKRPLATRLTLRDDTRSYLDFSCMNCLLGTMDAGKWEKSKNIVARLCLPLMKCDPKDKLRIVARAYEGLKELEPDEGKRVKWSEFIAMYSRMNKKEELEFREKYVESTPFGREVMTLRDIWLKEATTKSLAQGRTLGLEQGKNEGKIEGKIEGKAEGTVEGSVSTLLALNADGLLSAAQTRQRIKALQSQSKGGYAKTIVADALKKIKN